MAGWPWPESEVGYAIRQGTRALGGGKAAHRRATRYLRTLAVPDHDGAPVRELEHWVKQQSRAVLRIRIEQSELHRLAVKEAGWPNKRGDLLQIRSPMTWPVRTR